MTMTATMRTNVNGFTLTHEGNKQWLSCPNNPAMWSAPDYVSVVFYATHFELCECDRHEANACECVSIIDSHESYLNVACTINRELCDDCEDGMN